MRFYQKIFLYLFIFLAVAIFGLYTFVQSNGKLFLEEKLGAALRRKVEVGGVRFVFPIGLRLDQIKIERLFAAKEARVYMNFPFWTGRTVFISSLSVREPTTIFKKREDGQLAWGETVSPAVEESRVAAEASSLPQGEDSPREKGRRTDDRPSWKFLIDQLEIKDGRLSYADASSARPFSLEVQGIQIKARSVPIPLRSVNTSFNFAAKIFGKSILFSGSELEGSGWINFYEKNMDGQMKIKEPSGAIALAADLKAEHNDLTITGRAKINTLAGSEAKEGHALDRQDGASTVEDFLMGALHISGLKIESQFTMRTTLDDPQWTLILFSGIAGAAEKGTLREGLKSIGEKFGELGKQFKEPAAPAQSAGDQAPVENLNPPPADPVGGPPQPTVPSP